MYFKSCGKKHATCKKLYESNIYELRDNSLQCKHIFGERTLSTSSRNALSLSWILKAEEGWGEIEITLTCAP